MPDKILIVDDETEIADLIEVYLKNEEYTVFKFYIFVWQAIKLSAVWVSLKMTSMTERICFQMSVRSILNRSIAAKVLPVGY